MTKKWSSTRSGSGTKRQASRAARQATKPKDNDDESFASRAIEAELDHAMGVDNPDYDWLVEPYK